MIPYVFIAVGGIVLGFIMAHALYTADAFMVNSVCSRCVKKTRSLSGMQI